MSANSLTVNQGLVFDKAFRAVGGIDLERATVGTLVDDRESWPRPLNLDGFTYGGLTYAPAKERLEWLNRSDGYSPQPFEQLAGYYRRLGHDEQARRVLLAKQRHRRRQRPWWARSWGWLQDALAGYGYAPGRALLLLVGAFVAGWLVFSARHPAPVGPGPHAAFNAALYTIDVLIPAPALGQANDWDPQGAGLAVAVYLGLAACHHSDRRDHPLLHKDLGSAASAIQPPKVPCPPRPDGFVAPEQACSRRSNDHREGHVTTFRILVSH